MGGLSSSLIHYMLKQMGRNSTISVGRPQKITKNEIKEYMQKNPYSLLKEMSVYFNCSITACWNALKRNNFEKKYNKGTTTFADLSMFTEEMLNDAVDSFNYRMLERIITKN